MVHGWLEFGFILVDGLLIGTAIIGAANALLGGPKWKARNEVLKSIAFVEAAVVLVFLIGAIATVGR